MRTVVTIELMGMGLSVGVRVDRVRASSEVVG